MGSLRAHVVDKCGGVAAPHSVEAIVYAWSEHRGSAPVFGIGTEQLAAVYQWERGSDGLSVI